MSSPETLGEFNRTVPSDSVILEGDSDHPVRVREDYARADAFLQESSAGRGFQQQHPPYDSADEPPLGRGRHVGDHIL